jgi:hypothetical protein
LCLFAHFPFDHHVLPVVDSDYLTICTETVQWLTQDYDLYLHNMSKFFTYNSLYVHSLCNATFNSEMIVPRLRKTVSLCDLTKNADEYHAKPDDLQIIYLVMSLNDILVFCLVPFACFSGLVLNCSVIRTIKKNQTKELKEQFFKYMSLNSKFNCLYCLIFAFYPVNFCLDPVSTEYCSSIASYSLVQYYKIVVIAYVGEGLKMCSNISYTLMTINRYMLIGRTHLPLLERISKIDYSKVVKWTLVLSFLANLGHLDQYIYNEGFVFLDEVNYYEIYDVYPMLNRDSIFFPFYKLAYFFVNFFVFLVINTGVEIITSRKLQAELLQKQSNVLELKTKEDTAKMKKQVEEDGKKNRRAILMVVLNSCINFCLRLPEIFVFVGSDVNFLLYHYQKIASVFQMTMFATFLEDFAYFAYILTFSTNCFMYFTFNRKLKKIFVKTFLKSKKN